MDGDSKERVRLVDLIIPVSAVVYAIYYVVSVRDFPFQAQITGLLLGSLLGPLCTVFFIRFVWQARRSGIRIGWIDLIGEPSIGLKRLIFAGLILLSISAVPWGGFTLTTFVFLVASFHLLGVRPLTRVLVTAATAAIAGWLFFIVLLGARFPRGPFELLMSYWI